MNKIAFGATIVEMEVKSVKESKNWDAKHPKSFEIEFEVPYDQNSVFHKMSGGTNTVLRTVNEAVAPLFPVGQKVRFTIEPIAAEEAKPEPIADGVGPGPGHSPGSIAAE